MDLTELMKYSAALPELKAWAQATISLVEKLESIQAASGGVKAA